MHVSLLLFKLSALQQVVDMTSSTAPCPAPSSLLRRRMISDDVVQHLEPFRPLDLAPSILPL